MLRNLAEGQVLACHREVVCGLSFLALSESVLLDLLCGLWLIPGYKRERERESGLGGAALLFFCLIWLSDGKDRAPCKNISRQPWDLNVPSQHSPALLFFRSLIFSLLRSWRSFSRRRRRMRLRCYWHRDMVLIRWQTSSDIFPVMLRLALFLT